jgi:hypothetical protein
MTYQQIVEVLGYAGGQERPVRVTTVDRRELIGVPTSVDTHVTAHEVYLRLPGAGETAIAISLGAITLVELM